MDTLSLYIAAYNFLKDSYDKYYTNEDDELAFVFMLGDMEYIAKEKDSRDSMCLYFFKKALDDDLTPSSGYLAMIKFIKDYIEPWPDDYHNKKILKEVIESLEKNREENEEKYRKYL